YVIFFFQAEDGIRDFHVTGVQTCALPISFTALAPTDPLGVVTTGWQAFPFGWAFDVSTALPPGGALATLLQAVVGFMPRMSWLQVLAWAAYVLIVGIVFFRGGRSPRRSSEAPSRSIQGVPA